MPALAGSRTVHVEGLRELSRAFALADKAERTLFREALIKVAEPVRADAEMFAVERISSIGLAWSRMRVGVTSTSVYVAPARRGARGRNRSRRPNLAPLLMNNAMTPALAAHESDIAQATDNMLRQVEHIWERA